MQQKDGPPPHGTILGLLLFSFRLFSAKTIGDTLYLTRLAAPL